MNKSNQLINMERALEAATARFVERNPKSRELHQSALASLPGGNTRTLLYIAPFPISLKNGKGCKLYDEDGHESVLNRLDRGFDIFWNGWH